MKKHLLLGLALGAAVVFGHEPAAEACGGCFLPVQENPSVVTDHRMIFSISKDQSTLYDQIQYSGNPASFAWVLPFAGDIEVGVSSDTLFSVLDANTQTVVQAPSANCAPPPYCGSSGGSSSGAAGYGVDPNGGVTVLHNEVVGPYETVQLKATDPQALDKWLTDHGYSIPEAVKPVVAAYQAEHFNFLALKLVPGKDVQAMKPVRVTTKGANVALPLRMVAAGTGATVGITLWIVAEGRYEPSNFDSFHIEAEDLTWDYATQTSNFKAVRDEREAAAKGRTWEIESATKSLWYPISNSIRNYDNDWDEETGDAGVIKTADAARDHDLGEVLFHGMTDSAWVTRLRVDLAHDALNQDLTLESASAQEELPRIRYVTNTVNRPVCPTYTPCPSSSSGSPNQGANAASPNGDDDGCQTSPRNTSLPWLGVFVAAALTVLVRNRKEKR